MTIFSATMNEVDTVLRDMQMAKREGLSARFGDVDHRGRTVRSTPVPVSEPAKAARVSHAQLMLARTF